MVHGLHWAVVVAVGQLVLVSCGEPHSIAIDCTPASPEELRNKQPEKLLWSSRDYQIQSQLMKLEITANKSKGYVRGVPDLAIRAYGGWLFGFDHGEWGGVLVYQSASGDIEILAEDNFYDIYSVPFGYVAFTSLNHLTLNEGKVYRVTQVRDRFRVEQSHVLPGAPRSVYLLKGGGILVQVDASKFGDRLESKTLLVGEDGSLRSITCN